MSFNYLNLPKRLERLKSNNIVIDNDIEKILNELMYSIEKLEELNNDYEVANTNLSYILANKCNGGRNINNVSDENIDLLGEATQKLKIILANIDDIFSYDVKYIDTLKMKTNIIDYNKQYYSIDRKEKYTYSCLEIIKIYFSSLENNL